MSLSPVALTVIVLGVVWLIGMSAMGRGKAPRPRWIQTTDGDAWVTCELWPKEGQSVRATGYHGIQGGGYNAAFAQDGTLSLKGGVYTWTASIRRSYLTRY